ncbi:MAG TPA: ABC transporter permease [Candidatus Dormibacteraeota bacterium]
MTWAQKVVLPKLGAVAIVVVLWELALLRWQKTNALPTPAAVLQALLHQVQSLDFYQAILITMSRAVVGYLVALVLGAAIALVMAVAPVVRSAVGALITGLQTLPSISWFPLALLLFSGSETAILFVVILGATPSIANGVISGIDTVPVPQVQAARVLGARGVYLYRRVILPGAMPQVLAGLKQGWAFAWRSLIAGELLVIVAGRPSLGVKLDLARHLHDAATILALLIVLLTIGILVDFGFGRLESRVRRQRGLLRHAL